jgi:hypothetical protein
MAAQQYMDMQHSTERHQPVTSIGIKPDGTLKITTRDNLEVSVNPDSLMFVEQSPIIQGKFGLKNRDQTLLNSDERRNELIDLSIQGRKSQRNQNLYGSIVFSATQPGQGRQP